MMTDEQIIKAWEICKKKEDHCDDCPYNCIGCQSAVMKDSVDLIKHQKAEIERLQVELYKLRVSYDCELAYRKELHKQAKTEKYREFWNRLKKEADFISGGDYGFSFEIREDVAEEIIKELAGE